jgi:Ribophorin I
MKLSQLASICSLFAGSVCAADSNLTTSQSSQQLLRGDFRPPQVFKNVNLVRNTNLDKGYVRETINVVIENVDKQPQSEYYIPFKYDVIAKVGGMEVRDKKNAEKGRFDVQLAATSEELREDGTSSKFVTPVLKVSPLTALQINPILYYPFSGTSTAQGSIDLGNLIPFPLLSHASPCNN